MRFSLLLVLLLALPDWAQPQQQVTNEQILREIQQLRDEARHRELLRLGEERLDDPLITNQPKPMRRSRMELYRSDKDYVLPLERPRNDLFDDPLYRDQ